MKLFLSPFLLSLFCLFSEVSGAQAPKKVYINQIVEHPALDASVRGIIDALQEEGYEAGKNLDLRIESAQGNAALASQISSKFAHQSPDVVVGIGTVSAQSFSKYAREGRVKLVFCSVTDPLGAGLVKTLQDPQNSTSGVSNFVPLAPQLKLFKTLQPKLKKLGLLYNPGEVNSVSILKKLEELCPQFEILLFPQTANKTADVYQNALKLAQSVDAIFISNDNTALSALQSVLKAAETSKIPVYVSDTDAVELGAIAALGPNQYEIGKQTGQLIVRILKGANIGEQPVEFPQTEDLFLNTQAASKAHISIEKDLLARAFKIIKAPK